MSGYREAARHHGHGGEQVTEGMGHAWGTAPVLGCLRPGFASAAAI